MLLPRLALVFVLLALSVEANNFEQIASKPVFGVNEDAGTIEEFENEAVNSWVSSSRMEIANVARFRIPRDFYETAASRLLSSAKLSKNLIEKVEDPTLAVVDYVSKIQSLLDGPVADRLRESPELFVSHDLRIPVAVDNSRHAVLNYTLVDTSELPTLNLVSPLVFRRDHETPTLRFSSSAAEPSANIVGPLRASIRAVAGLNVLLFKDKTISAAPVLGEALGIGLEFLFGGARCKSKSQLIYILLISSASEAGYPSAPFNGFHTYLLDVLVGRGGTPPTLGITYFVNGKQLEVFDSPVAFRPGSIMLTPEEQRLCKEDGLNPRACKLTPDTDGVLPADAVWGRPYVASFAEFPPGTYSVLTVALLDSGPGTPVVPLEFPAEFILEDC